MNDHIQDLCHNVKAFLYVKSEDCVKFEDSCALKNCTRKHMHRNHVRLRKHCKMCDNNDWIDITLEIHININHNEKF